MTSPPVPMKFLDDVPAILESLKRVPVGSRIAIYGAGRAGKTVAGLIQSHRGDLNLSFFVDTFKSGELAGLPIYHPDALPSHVGEIDQILIASSSWFEIEDEMSRRGIHCYLSIKKPLGFKGWGLVTDALPPWDDGIDEEPFLMDHEDLKRTHRFSGSHAISDDLDNVRWRNWGIAFAARYALDRSDTPSFVECGVCDGMSAFFAMREARRRLSPELWSGFRMHLYDSWQPMSEKYLLPSEKLLAGEYDGLSIEAVRENLAEFSENTEFHPGFIPDSLGVGTPPDSVCYLHIDLNSAGPTVAALEFFMPRMQPGSLVILDDYGFDNYRETRQAVNSFLRGRAGQLLPLPTGGAYYFV
jgi:hypothetical protein